MDISVFVLEKIFGKDPQTIARIFVLRMWSGYCFDVGEITFLSLYVGINYKSDTWRYVFYGYCGFLGLVAMLLTITFIQCIIGKDSRRYNIVPYIMTYFKLTSAINAGFVFFHLWYSGNRDDVVVVLMVFTGIDIGLDILEIIIIILMMIIISFI